MKRLAIELIAAAGLLCAFAVRADIVVPKEHNGVDVTIRESASSQSDSIGVLPFGESRQWLGSTSHWHEIRLSGGQSGFVSKVATRRVRLPSDRDTDQLRIHYLNVGAGSCTLIECPGQDAPPMVVDCGSVGTASFDLDGAQAATYIRHVLDGHDTDANVVISHPHTDHYSLIPVILDGIEVQNLWLGGDDAGYDKKDFPEWLQALDLDDDHLHIGHAQDFHNDGEAIEPQVLGCGLAEVFTLTVNTGDNANANSHVMEIRYEDFGATFTGDAQGITEDQARANFDGDIKTTVLSASHHGANTHGSNGPEWVEATDPEIVIFSSGPRFAHPRCDIVERYEAGLATAPPHPTHCGDTMGFNREHASRLAKYVTATNGLIVITSDGTAPAEVFCDAQADCGAEIEH